MQANVFVVTSTARAACIAACAYCIRMAYVIIMFSGNLFRMAVNNASIHKIQPHCVVSEARRLFDHRKR